MATRTLIVATAALAASAAFVPPASAGPDRAVRGAVAFWLLDRNNDGAIDKAEIEQLRAIIFDAVDANGDGRVTKDEFVDVIERAQEWHGRHGPRHGYWEEHGERGGPHKSEFTTHRGEQLMGRLGIDAPGGLSKTDFVARTSKLLERTDKDDNGDVSKAEFEQAAGNIGRLILMD